MRPTLTLLALASLAACADKAKPLPAITSAWSDSFERAAPGADYHDTDPGSYAISGGMLHAHGARNHPLWLRRPIPHDAVIELDAKSLTPDGDIKVEIWGDGHGHAANKDKVQYTSSGYVFIFGGWSNSASIIAKGNEHTPGLPTRREPRVEPGRLYHWKIVRKGAQIDWYIDDMSTPFLSMTDPAPFDGPDHSYFAFSNWDSDLWFDNLSITPLSP
jgi:hypothetical protein